MLQGAGQQNQQQNIPENIPTLRDGLAAIRNSGIAIDAEKIFAERDALDSTVIADGWVACSERMPENDDFVYIWPRPDFGVELHVAQYGKFDKRGAGWYAQVYEQNYGIEYYPVKVTHWMPLPAAPQQEISHALAKGMERYGDAMQDLAKKEVK
ncbi:DUF551 domain-containing protein [Escherichia coli]|nr:DUF551 domain-containing protein [Escherichia coli]